jgi:hypothetical protein
MISAATQTCQWKLYNCHAATKLTSLPHWLHQDFFDTAEVGTMLPSCAQVVCRSLKSGTQSHCLKVKHHLTMCYWHYGPTTITPSWRSWESAQKGCMLSTTVQAAIKLLLFKWPKIHLLITDQSQTQKAAMDLAINGNHNNYVFRRLPATSAHLVPMTQRTPSRQHSQP